MPDGSIHCYIDNQIITAGKSQKIQHDSSLVKDLINNAIVKEQSRITSKKLSFEATFSVTTTCYSTHVPAGCHMWNLLSVTKASSVLQ